MNRKVLILAAATLGTLMSGIIFNLPKVEAESFNKHAVHRLKSLKRLHDCPKCNLSGANLMNLNLSGADLRGANLSGANLSGTILRGAMLTEANLTNANLSRAKLNGAYLVRANLDGAVWEKSDWRGAILPNESIFGDAGVGFSPSNPTVDYTNNRQGIIRNRDNSSN